MAKVVDCRSALSRNVSPWAEAVALSAGGRRDVLAVQALLQLLLPLLAFALAALLAKRAGKNRRGLR